MYDSTTPSAIPGGHVVATYATGPFAVPASQVAGRPVFWIDTNGSDPGAQALDVEPGDATPSMAATWAWQRLHADPSAKAVIYTMRSEWAATQAAIGTLPRWMQNHVRWWIADPTGYQHIVPGSNATQWYWGTNYDISTVMPGF
jgi:predicted NAD/FAD-dependent oxidoreductase